MQSVLRLRAPSSLAMMFVLVMTFLLALAVTTVTVSASTTTFLVFALGCNVCMQTAAAISHDFSAVFSHRGKCATDRRLFTFWKMISSNSAGLLEMCF